MNVNLRKNEFNLSSIHIFNCLDSPSYTTHTYIVSNKMALLHVTETWWVLTYSVAGTHSKDMNIYLFRYGELRYRMETFKFAFYSIYAQISTITKANTVKIYNVDSIKLLSAPVIAYSCNKFSERIPRHPLDILPAFFQSAN